MGKHIGRWFLPVLILILFGAGFVFAASEEPTPQNGILDLTNWNPGNGKALSLDGEWEFYWERLLTKDTLSANDPDAVVPVPSAWNEYVINGEKLSGEGFATYRLHIKTAAPEGTMLAFRMYTCSSAYRLYVDDRLIASNGTVSETKERETGEYRPLAASFAAPGEDFDIILQVSNHQYARGGIWYRIYFGGEEAIGELHDKIMGKEYFILGTLIITALFYFSLFILQRELRHYLWFSLLCLFMGVCLDMVGQFVIPRWLPGLTFSQIVWLFYTSVDWTFFFLFLYMHELFPSKFSRIVVFVYLALFSVSQVFYLLTPSAFYTKFGIISDYIAVIGILLTIVTVLIGARKGYREAWLNLLCLFVVFASYLHDLLYWTNKTANSAGEIIYGGLFAAILLQMIIQARRTKAYYDSQAAAELSFLQAQIKPHFLFNAINTFIAISREDTEKARTLLIDFSNYLRRSFDFKNMSQFVPLCNEIELAQAYAAIEKARFEERLEIRFSLPDDLSVMVPTMVLQPLIENAVAHGILAKPEGGVVEIRIEKEKNRLRFMVKDNGIGMKEEPLRSADRDRPDGGIGLHNINGRLQRLYGKGLTIRSEENVGTEIEWVIPISAKGGKQNDSSDSGR